MDARAFITAHAATLNGIVARAMPDPGETGVARLERGFSTAFKAALDALSRRAGPTSIDTTLGIARLLVTAIARRYYAFPDRHVVSVCMDVLFDDVLPRAIDAGCLDGGTTFLETMFNAGEHLGPHSGSFYRIVNAIADVMPLAAIPIDVLVHACAWMAEDERYRARAVELVATRAFPGDAFLAVAGLGASPGDARDVVAALVTLLAGDRWATVQGLRAMPVVAGAAGDPARLARDIETCLAATRVDAATTITTLLSHGAFEGFGGDFDTPPVVAGVHEGQLVAVTGTGAIFHGTFGGSAMRLRRAGMNMFTSVLFLPPGRILGVDAARRVVDLGTLAPIARLPGAGPAMPVAGCAGQVATVDARAKALVGVRLDTGEIFSHAFDMARDVGALAVLPDGSIITATGDATQGIHIHGPRGFKKLLEAPGPVALAPAGTRVACLDATGLVHLVDPVAGTAREVQVPTAPGTVTSFHVTTREFITTRTRTFSIHLAGWPPGAMP